MTLDTQDEVEEAIEEDEEEEDRVEWPPFDGDGYAPKEPHALGERPQSSRCRSEWLFDRAPGSGW